MAAPQYTISSSTPVAVMDLPAGDPDTVGSLLVEVKGITAAVGSFTPQIRARNGVTYYNKQYITWPTEATVTAGTAITADGIYKVLCDRCILAANITVLGGSSWTITVYPMQG